MTSYEFAKKPRPAGSRNERRVRRLALMASSGLVLAACRLAGPEVSQSEQTDEMETPSAQPETLEGGGGSVVDPDGAIAPASSGEGPSAGSVARDENGMNVMPSVADTPPDLRCQADAALPQRVDYAQPGPYGVATMEVTFEDASRPILATDSHSAAPSRRLVTTIHYPTSGQAPPFGPAPVASGAPFPLLMYSHGYSSSRNEGVPVATRATSYGYIVVAPDFPLTNILANGGSPDVTDAANQPGDVSFLMDQVLALSRDSSHPLAHAVDEARIGALGVSLGGLTTLLVSFHPRLHDERIKAAVPIAPLSSFFAEGFYHTRALPLLLLHGDMDAFIDYERNARRAFERAAPNARLITVAQGTHAAFGAQLDPATLALLNALLGAPNAHPSNPDGVGCGAVGATLSMTGPNVPETLGGPADFIAPDDTEFGPCQGDEYTRPALDSSEQEDIAVRSVVAFFDAHLANTPETRQDGCRYLLRELPKTPSVRLE